MFPKKQHDLPAAYLRRFSKNKKNHVWCLYKDDYKGRIINEKSVTASFFKYEHIYTLTNSETPYFLETNILKNELEDKYFPIANKIQNQENLTPEEIGFLSTWMYISEFRNLNFKKDTGEQFKIFLKNLMTLERKMTKSLNEEINSVVDENLKPLHLKSILSKEGISKFCDLMTEKSWEIISPPNGMKFITNDNPGFSINLNTKIPINKFSVHSDAINIYPLTPNHCLHIIPLSLCSEDNYNKVPKIYYKQSSPKTTTFINQCTVKFHKRFLIASTKDELEKIKKNLN